MAGAVIGKRMNLGYIGKISRDADAIVINRITDGESEAIDFGSAVFLTETNTVRNAATEDTVGQFVGVAVATVVQATEYTQQASAYLPNKACDILVRGSIIVELGTGTPVAGGQVYFNKETGAFDAQTSASAIQIPASFTTGYVDGKGGVEITILKRNLI